MPYYLDNAFLLDNPWITVFGQVPAVERDLYWQPKTLGEIKRGSSLAA